MGQGPHQGTKPNETPNAGKCYLGKQAAGDKIRSQEGYSPDYRQKLLMGVNIKMVTTMTTLMMGLEAAIHLRNR